MRVVGFVVWVTSLPDSPLLSGHWFISLECHWLVIHVVCPCVTVFNLDFSPVFVLGVVTSRLLSGPVSL